MPKYGRAAHAVTITHTGPGDTKVVLDGTDIATSLTGLNLTMGVGQVPTVTLDLRIFGVTEIQDVEARILIPDATRDTLIALGWTPPADPSAEPIGNIKITGFLNVYLSHPARGDYGWSWGCWGDGACEGYVSDHVSLREYAERKAREHIAAHHPTPAEPEQTGDLDVTPFLVVHRYPDRVGSRSYSWSWHCWGHGTCAGWTALDFTNRDHAERSARGHLATEHPAEQTATED